jgi:hypothetical protein
MKAKNGKAKGVKQAKSKRKWKVFTFERGQILHELDDYAESVISSNSGSDGKVSDDSEQGATWSVCCTKAAREIVSECGPPTVTIKHDDYGNVRVIKKSNNGKPAGQIQFKLPPACKFKGRSGGTYRIVRGASKSHYEVSAEQIIAHLDHETKDDIENNCGRSLGSDVWVAADDVVEYLTLDNAKLMGAKAIIEDWLKSGKPGAGKLELSPELEKEVRDWCKPHGADPARFIAFAVEHWLDAVDQCDGNAAAALEASGGNWKPFQRRFERITDSIKAPPLKSKAA